MIYKNLLRRKFRTLMFIVGICVVLTGMQVLLGVSNGIDSNIESILQRENIHLVVLEQNSVMAFSSLLPEEMGAELATEPGIATVHANFLGLLQTESFPMLVIWGLEPDRLQSLKKMRLLEGRFPQAMDEVIIGKRIRGGFDAPVGGTISLNNQTLRVVGFFESQIETEEGSIMMPLKGAQQLFNKAEMISSISIQLAKPDQLDLIRAALKEKYPTVKITRAEDYAQSQQNLEFIKGIGKGVSILSVVGGAIIVFIFSLIIVQERVREIALLRAIGWRRSRIIRLIMGETLVLSFLGALASLGVSSIVLMIMRGTPSIASMMPVSFTWQSVIIALSIALALGFTGGLLSAWKASNLNPTEAFGRE